jgi:glycerophosphoryl diester phosphodiesterase
MERVPVWRGLVGLLAMAARPLVLGHRGASAVAPENTLAAFVRARELGADGVELDVRRTADDVLVVHHDPEVEGFGVIVAARFAELRAAHPAIPTLAEALDACRGLLVNAEIKCLPWEPDPDTDGRVARATVDAIVAAGTNAVISSFDLNAVDRVRSFGAGIETGWLTHGQVVADAARTAAEHGHEWVNPDFRAALAAGPVGIGAAHETGVRVSVWTVDAQADARALATAGVDIIITNAPDVIGSAMTDL